MARRKKFSTAEDLIHVVALLPWWAGVALALILYVVLHRIAIQPMPVPGPTGQEISVPMQSLWRGLATFGQYALPILCLAGAGVSAWKRKRRTALVADVAQSQASDVLDGMSWREFEILVGEGFRLQGYQVLETGGEGPDGGVDLVLRRGGEKFLVQCKQWRAFKVGVDVVRELYGVMAARGATGGFAVTSGRFTDDASRFAIGRNIRLVDGPKLHGLIQQARASSKNGTSAPPTTAVAPIAPMAPAVVAVAAPAIEPTSLPSCPLCTKPMARRIAKRGTNAGSEFWGCTGYPTCRGTRAIT